MRNNHFILLVLAFFITSYTFSQATFSISTDLAALRSFKKEQQFWSVGQTIRCDFHLTARQGAYIWYAYTAPGKFSNDLIATANSSTGNPSQINFTNHAALSFKHLSIGWRQYLKGTYHAEEAWNLYCTAGFGLVGGRITNSFSSIIDTSLYTMPAQPVAGDGKFKRLTLDLGLGYEVPLGGSIYVYGEGRAWIPTSDYPSKYLLVSNHAPLSGTLNLGIRILFD